MWGIPRAIRPPISSAGSPECRANPSFTPWVSMHLACLQKSTRSRPIPPLARRRAEHCNLHAATQEPRIQLRLESGSRHNRSRVIFAGPNGYSSFSSILGSMRRNKRDVPFPNCDSSRSQGGRRIGRTPLPRLAPISYLGEALVNWCPGLGTVLANEEVQDGKSERGGHPIQRIPLRQWLLRITSYAERLLADLEGLDWSPSIKKLQQDG